MRIQDRIRAGVSPSVRHMPRCNARGYVGNTNAIGYCSGPANHDRDHDFRFPKSDPKRPQRKE